MQDRGWTGQAWERVGVGAFRDQAEWHAQHANGAAQLQQQHGIRNHGTSGQFAAKRSMCDDPGGLCVYILAT